ncbi:MAG: hypothetical protein RL701_4902 [Pseudomonadota bacterium]
MAILVRFVLLSIAVSFSGACAPAPLVAAPSRNAVSSVQPAGAPSLHQSAVPDAQPWEAASAGFRSNKGWLGADSAYSIDLDASRVLWLFADTFLDPALDGSRTDGPNYFIRNSVAIQTGPTPEAAHDLSQSTLSYYWGAVDKAKATPTSYFHDLEGGARWLWPMHGVRLPSGEVLVFRMQVIKTQDAFGFEVDSWDAIAIDDAKLAPDRWQPRTLTAAKHQFGKIVGTSVLIHDGQLYAYAVDEPSPEHAVYLARWSLAQLAGLAQGALDDPEWWTARGFVRESALHGAQPALLFKPGQAELSVHFEPARARFVEVQMSGLFVTDPKTQLSMRTALRPEGPWSDALPFFRPGEAALANAADWAAYAGKAHPEQRGADLVLTYVVNDLKRFPPTDQVYYPQVLRAQYGQTTNSGAP